jgi:transposase InsO family protein
VALHRARQADAKCLRRKVGFAALRVNGRLRDECLNETLFTSMAHAQFVLAAWRDDYNTVRPHSKLGGRTPTEIAGGHRLAQAGDVDGRVRADGLRCD